MTEKSNYHKDSRPVSITKFIKTLGGEEIEYDICISVRFAEECDTPLKEMYPEYVYLGTGFISEVNGEQYKGKTLCHFWKYK